MEDHDEMSGQEIHELVSRWAGESKNLLLALPSLLAKLAELQGEANQLRNRIMDLELDNANLRQSRADLAETFGKMKDLIAGTALDAATGTAAADDTPSSLEASRAELEPTEAADVEPANPEPADLERADLEPDARSAEPAPAATADDDVSEEPAEPAAGAPSEPQPAEPASQSAAEPASPPAPEPPPETSSDPSPPKSRWPPPPSKPASAKAEERAPAPPPVRFSTAFRPPASKN